MAASDYLEEAIVSAAFKLGYDSFKSGTEKGYDGVFTRQ